MSRSIHSREGHITQGQSVQLLTSPQWPPLPQHFHYHIPSLTAPGRLKCSFSQRQTSLDAYFKIAIFNIYLIYLKGRVITEWGKEDRERENIDLPSAGTLPNGQRLTRLNPGASSYFQVPHRYRGPSTWANLYCSARYISRQLEWKWSKGDSNQYPHRMRVLQAFIFLINK